MSVRPPVQWLRRLLAHVTTPLLPALYWWLTLGSDRNSDDLWATIWLCYLGWLLLGLPGVLLRRAEPKRPWVYAAWAAAVPTFFLTIIGIGWRSEDWSLYAFIPIFALAGLWYWACAYWRPDAAGEQAVRTA